MQSPGGSVKNGQFITIDSASRFCEKAQMPSPTGAYVGLSSEELATIRAAALLRITQGDRTSLSGGGKSGSKNWRTDPRDDLREVQWAMDRAAGVRRVTHTYFRSGHRYGTGVAVGASTTTPDTPTVDNVFNFGDSSDLFGDSSLLFGVT